MGLREDFSGTSLSLFDSVDRDRNGFIDKQEIGRTATIGTNSAGEAAAIATMKLQYDALRAVSNDEWGRETSGITKADLRGTVAPGVLPDLQLGSVNNWVTYAHRTGRDLYANAKPSEMIRPDAIWQGGAGDCWFLASLAGMADTQKGKDAIEKMITPVDGGKQFVVKFPGDPTPVRVNAPTEFELMQFAKTSSYGSWVPVMEKALGQYLRRTAPEKEVVPAENIGGRPIDAAIGLLTNNKAKTEWLANVTDQEMSNIIQNALNDKRITTAGIMPDATNEYELPTNHAYTILGYDAATGKVRIRNPWSGNVQIDPPALNEDGKQDGCFTMTLAQFRKVFGYMTYETQEKKE